MPTIEESMRAMLLRIVEGNTLFRVLSGLPQLSQVEQGIPQGVVRLQEKSGVSYPLRQA
jgi:hypothetical protein